MLSGVVMNSSDKELASFLLTSLCGPHPCRKDCYLSMIDGLKYNWVVGGRAVYTLLLHLYKPYEQTWGGNSQEE